MRVRLGAGPAYQIARGEIAEAIGPLVETRNVVVNRPAVATGLSVFDAGGNFADGVIAHDGEWMGGETFVSFDRKAVSLIAKQGYQAQLLC